ncbi:hypothetical protein [uncultured Aquimarina sp.]|uniref:hypothetical protein n=1 Tax=uncultured Aquimarina sp. TaxID=575652 RepID=UPI0026255CD8|nr:hypothetical protein [uncultured Aquimarina sp.]
MKKKEINKLTLSKKQIAKISGGRIALIEDCDDSPVGSRINDPDSPYHTSGNTFC